MSAKQASRLLIDEQPLQVIPSLACRVGLNRAMFLQQLHYWLEKSGHERDGKKWVFNTYEEWHEQFPFWSAEAIRKIVSQLEDKGLIETTDRYNKRATDRTKWYTIDYETLDSLICQPDKSTDEPENLPPLDPDKSTERYQREESNNRDSLRGSEASEPPAKAMTTLTIDRTKEVGFDPAPHQKQAWGQGWSKFVYVPESEEPPSAERQHAVLNEIVAAAAGQRGQGRFFLSVQDAVSRVENGTRRRPKDEPQPTKEQAAARRKDGYEWLFR